MALIPYAGKMPDKRKRKPALVPYAGKEPENPNIGRRGRAIPWQRAKELRMTGLSWRAVANELEEEIGRCYTADSIAEAVKRGERKCASSTLPLD